MSNVVVVAAAVLAKARMTRRIEHESFPMAESLVGLFMGWGASFWVPSQSRCQGLQANSVQYLFHKQVWQKY